MSAVDQLNRAIGLIEADRHTEAEALLTPLLDDGHNSADVWQLMALARKGQRDLSGAETAFIRSIELFAAPAVITNLGNLYRQMNRDEEALGCYDRALAAAPSHLPARINKGRALLALARHREARDLYANLLEQLPEHTNARIGLAQALQGEGQHQAAMQHFEQALMTDPANAAALNGLGISQKVLGHSKKAVATLQQAVASAPAASEVHTNLASALALSGEESAAIAAYREALLLDPLNPELHDWFNGYLSMLGHSDYLLSYEDALSDHPTAAPLAIALARKLLLGERGTEALQVLEKVPVDTNQTRAHLACERSHILRESGEFEEALIAAREANTLLPNTSRHILELATSIMAAGADYQEAVDRLQPLIAAGHCGQEVLANYATALRYAQHNDAYWQLVDYEKWVGLRQIEYPEGYDDLEGFLSALRQELMSLHITRHHPVGQSLQYGTQTLDDLFSREDPIIHALKASLLSAAHSFAEALPTDTGHPVIQRRTGQVGFADSWSVLLRQQGFHKNHFHSRGWLSSAFYLTVPDEVRAGSKAGWIKFGEPGFRAREPLAPEHWLQPEEGALAIFPSYLWHGTQPLTADAERMTVGFDLVPAPS